MSFEHPAPSVHILLVEDHRATRDMLLAVLTSAFPEARVTAAGTSAEALAIARARRPDVVVMDIRLPDGNGIDALKGLRSEHPAVRVVMHSNHDLEVFREKSAAAGANAFVSKREGPASLIREIGRLLQHGARPDP